MNKDPKKIIEALTKDNHILCQQRNGMFKIIENFVNKGISDLTTILQVFCTIGNAQSGLLLTLPVEQREKELFDAMDLRYSVSVKRDIPKITKEIPILKDQFSGPIALLKTAPSNEEKQIEIDECMKIWNPRMTSYLWLPIVIGKQFFGVVILFKTSEESVFYSEEDIKLFSSMTEQTGLLIQYMISEDTKTELLISEKEKTERLFKSEKTKEELNKLIAIAIEDGMPYKQGHSERVKKLCVDIGKKMDFTNDDLKELEIAAMLHDVGKADFSDTLLLKPALAGSVWTKKERDEYNNHPQKGWEKIKDIPDISREIKKAVLYHHEFFNGKGNPGINKGKEIPQMARVIGVACAFDEALCQYRYNYNIGDRHKLYYELALEEIEQGISTGENNKKYDPEIVDRLKEVVQEEKNWMSKEDKLLSEAYELYKNNRIREAREHCYKILNNKKSNLLVQMAATKILETTEERIKAIEYYSGIIDENPIFVEAYYRRGRCYDKEGQLDKAGMDFAVATTICPTYLEAHLRLGQIRYRLGKFKNALESFQIVINEEPSNALARMEKGRTLSNMYYLTKEEDERKLQLTEATIELEEALGRIKDEESKERARQLNQNTYIEDEVHYLLAEVYEKLGNREDCKKELLKILKDENKDTLIYQKADYYMKSILNEGRS